MTGCAPNIFLYARLVRPCQLLHAGAAWPGLIGCLAAFGYLGWRPAWTRTTHAPVSAPDHASRGP